MYWPKGLCSASVRSHLDVNFHSESFCLAVSITDVKAEGVLVHLRFPILDVENVVGCQVLHGKRHIRGDGPWAADWAT